MAKDPQKAIRISRAKCDPRSSTVMAFAVGGYGYSPKIEPLYVTFIEVDAEEPPKAEAQGQLCLMPQNSKISHIINNSLGRVLKIKVEWAQFNGSENDECDGEVYEVQVLQTYDKFKIPMLEEGEPWMQIPNSAPSKTGAAPSKKGKEVESHKTASCKTDKSKTETGKKVKQATFLKKPAVHHAKVSPQAA